MVKAEWVSANEAAEIVSANNGRTVIPQYIRDLAQRRKIQYKPLDGRTNVYLRSDVEKVKVRANKKGTQNAENATLQGVGHSGSSTPEGSNSQSAEEVEPAA